MVPAIKYELQWWTLGTESSSPELRRSTSKSMGVYLGSRFCRWKTVLPDLVGGARLAEEGGEVVKAMRTSRSMALGSTELVESSAAARRDPQPRERRGSLTSHSSRCACRFEGRNRKIIRDQELGSSRPKHLLSDNIHPAGSTRNELDGCAVALLERLEELVPARALREQGGRRVDLVQRGGDRNRRERHCEGKRSAGRPVLLLSAHCV